MMKKILLLLFLLPLQIFAQNTSPLTVEKMMKDQRWIGTSPSDVFWSPNGQRIYFKWNPDQATSDSLYYLTLKSQKPQKANVRDVIQARAQRNGIYNLNKTLYAYSDRHRLCLLNLSSGKIDTLFQTGANINLISFSFNEQALVFQSGNNLFARFIQSGKQIQLTDFQPGKAPQKTVTDDQEQFLESDALDNSLVLRQRKAKQEEADSNQRQFKDKRLPKTIYLEGQSIWGISISADGKTIVYSLGNDPGVKNTIVPNYVTRSGYTEEIEGRPVVGTEQAVTKSFVYDLLKDTVYEIQTRDLPGIKDIPAFIKDYPKEAALMKSKNEERQVWISDPVWSDHGAKALFAIRALDHKDRWIMIMDNATRKLKIVDRQHDDAWVGGPGIGYPYERGNIGWVDDHTVWYQSEKTGYSHLYLYDLNTGKTRALTQGKYEIQDAELSKDKKDFYITTNEVEPGQMQFYQLNIQSGKQTRITQKEGGNQVFVAPDGQRIAFLFSTINHPWELYLQDNRPGAQPVQVTFKAESDEYKAYSWREPKYVTFKDRDGLTVYAEMYVPEHPVAARPAVLFVHGAGYLQDVVKYWGYYTREHMFMNMLTDMGYTVLDVDYRGSAGYGRDWRTAIYRHMGGKDLDDIEDGARFLVSNQGVNPKNIGIWGGSYGGFMTLMAMFKTKTFAAGGALRSVTDWAHYNHDYTSEILNLPQNDSLAYVQSSPIYFADGLTGNLLMCHGMVDQNVHFQDIVRLNQKLIELGKNNWQLAVYPMEDHGFVEPTSWTDEYKRILKLFEENLKN